MPRRRHPQAEFRQHKTLTQGQFAPGATIAQGATIREAVPCASSQTVRLRFLTDVNGTLSASFLRPGLTLEEASTFDEELDGTAEVTEAGNPDDVAVTGGTEALMEVTCAGEAWILLEFTEENVAAGTVTHLHVSQL